MLDLSKASHEQFEKCLNQRFLIEDESPASMELELVAVDPRGSVNPGGGTRQAFALTFRGPMASTLAQRIVPLTNETLGGLELFLVPIGPDEIGMLYEAVFT